MHVENGGDWLWSPNMVRPVFSLGYRTPHVQDVRSTCGETLNSTPDPVARAVGFHRVDFVVVSCPSLETVYTHSENGFGMVRVQPDWRFRCLAKVLGIRTVMHHSVMLGRSPRVVGCPPDNRKIGVSPFN